MWKNVHPVYGAVIQTEHESPPITTRPLDQGSSPIPEELPKIVFNRVKAE